jgi:hypothetical protein
VIPILPLDHPEPFAATLGVMLYPGTEDDDPQKARTFAARWLAEPIKRAYEAGQRIPCDVLLRVVMDGGWSLSDLDDRWWGGTTTGELFKTLWALFNTNPKLASWNNAIEIAELVARGNAAKGSRTDQWVAKSRFISVAHLWGAWCIRDRQFGAQPKAQYDGYDDFQSFLAEAEILRDWGQTWRPPRAKSSPFLPSEVWCVPKTWSAPVRQPGWPNTGMIPIVKLPPHLMAKLKPAGRPRKPS